MLMPLSNIRDVHDLRHGEHAKLDDLIKIDPKETWHQQGEDEKPIIHSPGRKWAVLS